MHSCSWFVQSIDHTTNTIFQDGFIKIQQETKLVLGQLKVAQHLSKMDIVYLIHGFDLHYDAMIHPEVYPEAEIKLFALIADRNGTLLKEGEAKRPEFLCQTMLIDALQEPRSQLTVHLDRGSDDRARKILVRHCSGFSLRLRVSAATYFTSANFPFSMLITAISLGSTPFFWAQKRLTQSPRLMRYN